MMTPTIDIQKEVEPHFKVVWVTKCPYVLLKGGRGSFKSSTIAIRLVDLLLPYLQRGEKANVVVIRKVGNTISDSVFLKMQWALAKFGLLDEFQTRVKPYKLIHRASGSTIYFYGQDDFQKLKSNDINDIIACWYEESAEFDNKEEFDQTNATFMRQKQPHADVVRFYWSWNPPRNPYHWINEWAEEMRSDKSYLVDSSSYLDDKLGFFFGNQQMVDEVERIKQNDFEYYRYLYLGEAVGMGINVYNFTLFHQLPALPDDMQLMGLYYGLDVGHEVSATTCVCVGLTTNYELVVLDTYYYSPAGKAVKKAPSVLAKDIAAFLKHNDSAWGTMRRSLVIDSAEGGLRNELENSYGIVPTPIAKTDKLNMIDNVQTVLAQGRVYVLDVPSNTIFLEEHKTYHYDEKTLDTANVRIVKKDDHTCDAFQYILLQNRKVFQKR